MAYSTSQTQAENELFSAKASVVFQRIWGCLPQISAYDLRRLRCTSAREVLDQNLKVKWIHCEHFDLCSLRISGPRGDDELYRIPDIKRLLPRTFIVPWNRHKQEFDLSQAITGLVKIAGMQDEGTQQILDLAYINQHCQGGQKISVEKANGKACSLWLKRFNGIEYLGFSSKTYAEPEFIYPLPQTERNASNLIDWVKEIFHSLTKLKQSETPEQSPIIQAVAYYSFKRLHNMSALQLEQFFTYLRSGITLCGELEEGGKHVIPTAKRVVFFAGSLLAGETIQITSPLACRQQLAHYGLQAQDELASTSEAFYPLNAQPSALALGQGLREGCVCYFLNPEGQVIASMKVKDPHYMFYRKLRNAMCSSAKTSQEILHRLVKSARDPYYLSCLKTAQIPADFSSKMLRSAASFLAWFEAQDDLGQDFDLAGFQGQQHGLGALIQRWRQAKQQACLGEYQHIKAHPDAYTFPQAWCEKPAHGQPVAMLSFHAAQGSGKTTLSRLLAHSFNQQVLSLVHHTQKMSSFALALEQDPLQKKKTYIAWLESSIYPKVKAWLNAHLYCESHPFPRFLPHDELPKEITASLAWSALGEGRTGRKFLKLLDHVVECFKCMQTHVKQAHATPTQSLGRSDAEIPKLLIINARCNQNQQANQGWQSWLEQQAISGHASLRLSAPLETLNTRISQRNREGDEALIGAVVETTHREVSELAYVDQDLDASQELAELLKQSLVCANLALQRVDERWFLHI